MIKKLKLKKLYADKYHVIFRIEEQTHRGIEFLGLYI